MSGSNVVDIQDVTFAYAKEPVLENVNLTVEPHDFASIVGPNGSGKTTLLKLLLGLIKPDSGEIKVFNHTPKKSRFRMGYIPQYIDLDLHFPVTVMDVVLMGRLGHSLGGRFSKKDKKAAQASLEEVDLKGLADQQFSELSGGQRQRVLIARALTGNPDLLLLDEPTSNIDLRVEKVMFETLQELNSRMTIMIVSHDMGFVSQVVKSVICVNRKVVVHPTSEINGEIIKEIYGTDLRMIRHDHRCSEGGHEHDRDCKSPF